MVNELTLYEVLAVTNHTAETRIRWHKQRGTQPKGFLNRANFNRHIASQN